MTNPFQQHRSALFSERDSIDAALHYVHEIIGTLEGADKAAALTAMMVLVNTAAKLWPEAPAQAEPSPVILDAAHLDALRSRIAALEEWRDGPSPIPTHFIQLVDERVLSWAEDHFTARADEWLSDDADLDYKIESWVEDNLDVEDAVQDVLRNASFRINF
jgi:hypothetical protein